MDRGMIDNRTCKCYCESFPCRSKEGMVLLGNYKLIVLGIIMKATILDKKAFNSRVHSQNVTGKEKW